MRTAAWGTAPQIALRNCSTEAAGKLSIYDFGEGGGAFNAIKRLFYKRFSVSLKELISP